jgi:hypothetical protein
MAVDRDARADTALDCEAPDLETLVRAVWIAGVLLACA